jgi:hypothetical protein
MYMVLADPVHNCRTHTSMYSLQVRLVRTAHTSQIRQSVHTSLLHKCLVRFLWYDAIHRIIHLIIHQVYV